MLKTCSRCGIVPIDHICPYKSDRKDSKAHTIRQTSQWHKKSLAIRKRDDYMCRICRLKRHNTTRQYNSEEIGVHHIVAIEEDDTKAFDDNNLISLCHYHHELAECGKIPREELLGIVEENIR